MRKKQKTLQIRIRIGRNCTYPERISKESRTNNEAENMAKRPRNIHQKWQVKPVRASKVLVFTLS